MNFIFPNEQCFSEKPWMVLSLTGINDVFFNICGNYK